MSRRTRRLIWYAINVAVFAAIALLLITWVGPARLLYKQPAARGSTKLADTVYLIPAAKDSVTIGKPGANVGLEKATIALQVAATLDRQPPGPGPRISKWVLTAEETTPTPVLLNGAPASGTPALAVGDVITVGGVDITFDGSRHGILGALDSWETGKITHLYASPRIISQAFFTVLKALPISLFVVIVSFALAIPGGLTLAFMKMAKTRWARWPATIYVDVIRGTPIFLQILLVFFGLPLMPLWQVLIDTFPLLTQAGPFGVGNSAYLRAFLVLAMNSAAYMAEIFRGGIQSINKGQMEAARSLGMSAPKAMGYVIIPQTVRRILPTMMSEFILLFKDTSLFAAVGLGEMVLRAREVAATTLNVSPYLLAAAFYLVITIPLGRLVQQLENRLAVAEGGGGVRREETKPAELTVAPSVSVSDKAGS